MWFEYRTFPFTTFVDIGASAFGRDYLSSCEAGHALIDVFCSVLAETPISAQWLACHENH